MRTGPVPSGLPGARTALSRCPDHGTNHAEGVRDGAHCDGAQAAAVGEGDRGFGNLSGAQALARPAPGVGGAGPTSAAERDAGAR